MPTQTLWTVIGFNSLALMLPLTMALLWWKPQLWLAMLTVFAGMMVGFITPRSSELQFPLLLLIAFGFFAGFSQPRHAWRWAVLLAIWVPINEAFAQLLGARTATADAPNIAASFFAFAPAFIGAYAGVLVHRVSSAANSVTSA